MSKRYYPPKEFARLSKKPKLDVNINIGRKGRQSTDFQHRQFVGNVDLRDIAFPNTSKAPRDGNFWDDDDDDADVILLATQAELENTKAAAAIDRSEFNITDTDMTFSEFAPKCDAGSSTSTQCHPVVAYSVGNKRTAISEQKTIAEIFENDDDFDLLIATATQVENKHITRRTHPERKNHHLERRSVAQKDHYLVSEDIFASEDVAIFRKPELPVYSKLAGKPSTVVADATSNVNSVQMPLAEVIGDGTDSSNYKRRQLASERQIQFLMDRVEALKHENEQLCRDLTVSKAKIETKEGEATLLRDELRHTKQQVQVLKREKLSTSEQVDKECKSKIAELSKQMAAKEAQLQLKSVEYSVLKMRRADESRRFELSMRDESMALLTEEGGPLENEMPTTAVKLPTKPIMKTNSSAWLISNLNLLNFQDDVKNQTSGEPSESLRINGDFYGPEISRVDIMKQISVFQVEQNNLQKIEGRMRSEHCDMEKIPFQVVESARKIFKEFSSYAHKLVYPNYTKILGPLDYDLLLDRIEHHKSCLHQVTPLYPGECCVHLRRSIAALSVICAKSSLVTMALLNAKDSIGVPLLLAQANLISLLGYALTFSRHLGVIEAFAVLAHSVINNMNCNQNELNGHESKMKYLEVVFELLKQIVFTRPTPYILKEISHCMLDFIRLHPESSRLFCINSPEHSFVVDRQKSVCRFYNYTCLLQVYCGLLENAVPLYCPLKRKHFKLLTVICLNQLRFIFELFTDPPDFIKKRLPSDSEEDDDELATTADNNDGATKAWNNSENSTITEKTNKMQTNTREDETPCSSSSAKRARCYKRENPIEKNHNLNSNSASNQSSSGTNESESTIQQELSADSSLCSCYMQMCVGILPLVYKVLREWSRSGYQWENLIVGQICRIAIHLIHIIFVDFYQTRLFYDDEDSTRHYLFMITHWCHRHMDKLNFSEMHKNCLEDLLESHIIPRDCSNDVPKLDNIASDLEQYAKETGEKIVFSDEKKCEESLRELKLIENIFSQEKLLNLETQQKFSKSQIFDDMLVILQRAANDSKS